MLLSTGTKTGVGGSESSLGMLRRFRDTVLAQTKDGSELITLYYQYSPEIVSIMAENPALMGRTLNLLLDGLPSLQATAGNGGELIVSKNTFIQATQLLNDYESHASAELRDALEKVKAFIDGRRKEIGSGRVEIDFSE